MWEIWRKYNIWLWIEWTAWTSANPWIWIPKTEANFKPVIEKVIEEWTYWRIESRTDSYIWKKMSELNFGWNVRDILIWYLLLWVFWQSSSALKGWESAVYNHTFNVLNSNSHKSFTLWGQDTIWTETATYWMIDSLDIESQAWWFVNYSVNFKAKWLSSWSTQSVSYSSENVFISPQLTIKFADNLSWLDWASTIKLSNLKLSFNKNLLEYFVNWSVDIEKILNQHIEVNWDFEAIFESTTYRDYVLNWTKKAMRITITNPTTIWTWSNPTLVFNFAQVSFDEWDRAQDSNWIMMQTLWFNAEYSLSDTSMVSSTLTNTKSNYTS